MARDMSTDQTEFYRALIEELRDGKWIAVEAFGPYCTKGQAQDRDARWFRAREGYENGTRRMKRQVQNVDASGTWIVWADID